MLTYARKKLRVPGVGDVSAAAPGAFPSSPPWVNAIIPFLGDGRASASSLVDSGMLLLLMLKECYSLGF